MMNCSKRYGASGHGRTSSSVRVRFVRPISPFPSPRPSPSGRGRILRWFSAIPCAVSARQTSRTSESAAGCSLSRWKRVRVRGIGLRSDKPTRANPVNVELCESSGAAGCLMRLGVTSFSKPSVVHEPGLLSFVLLAAALLGPVDGIQAADRDWPVYLGDKASTHFSTLEQINRNNVQRLQVAWTYHSGDARQDDRSQVQCNPLVIDGVLYGTSPQSKLLALDAVTGRELWRFDPFAGRAGT